jgi:hypothetical protein
MLVCDELTMLVTGDPVAELDSALSFASQRLGQARAADDTATATRLCTWIDHRLDERLSLARLQSAGPGAHCAP